MNTDQQDFNDNLIARAMLRSLLNLTYGDDSVKYDSELMISEVRSNMIGSFDHCIQFHPWDFDFASRPATGKLRPFDIKMAMIEENFIKGMDWTSSLVDEVSTMMDVISDEMIYRFRDEPMVFDIVYDEGLNDNLFINRTPKKFHQILNEKHLKKGRRK